MESIALSHHNMKIDNKASEKQTLCVLLVSFIYLSNFLSFLFHLDRMNIYKKLPMMILRCKEGAIDQPLDSPGPHFTDHCVPVSQSHQDFRLKKMKDHLAMVPPANNAEMTTTCGSAPILCRFVPSVEACRWDLAKSKFLVEPFKLMKEKVPEKETMSSPTYFILIKSEKQSFHVISYYSNHSASGQAKASSRSVLTDS